MDISEIPVRVHLVEDSTGIFTTTRNEADINGIFEQVNRIWAQARINFVLDDIQRETINNATVEALFDLHRIEASSNANFVDAFFVDHIDTLVPNFHVNGWSPRNLRRIFIGDHITVHAFRATAHELGHVLGLRHVDPIDRLMSQGFNGEHLINAEIETARNIASLF